MEGQREKEKRHEERMIFLEQVPQRSKSEVGMGGLLGLCFCEALLGFERQVK